MMDPSASWGEWLDALEALLRTYDEVDAVRRFFESLGVPPPPETPDVVARAALLAQIDQARAALAAGDVGGLIAFAQRVEDLAVGLHGNP